MSNFKPNRKDGRAIWRVIYDELAGRIKAGRLNINDVVTHEELRGLLEKNEQSGYYSAIRHASGELCKVHHRSLKSNRSNGYRLIGGAGQVDQGIDYKKRGNRNYRKGLALVRTADRAVMSPADRTWADKVEGGMVALAEISMMHDEKLMEHEARLRSLETSKIENKLTSPTKDEVDELRRRIDEIQLAKAG